MFEIVVIGAGIAGLTCARQLQAAGKTVVLIDKSRGLGGRLATRRLAGTHADHGVCYLQSKDERFARWIDELVSVGILRVWTNGIHSLSADGILHAPTKFAPYYAAPMGATSIAKYLGRDLEIIGDKLITAISPIVGVASPLENNAWRLSTKDPEFSLTAAQVIIATPPAQALNIVRESIDPNCIEQLASVQFTRSITTIAVYRQSDQNAAAAIPWQGIHCIEHPTLAWIGLDSSKQINPTQPVLVIQSSAPFAEQHFDAPDLSIVGQKLIEAVVPFIPTLHAPELIQVHRWGYAFAKNSLSERFLTAQTIAPLYVCGDWCGGNRVESAYLSGMALADEITRNS